jgi:hypothetical protein
LPDHCGQGEKALADAGADAGEGAAGVAFEVELSFEGVEDGLDDLAQWYANLLVPGDPEATWQHQRCLEAWGLCPIPVVEVIQDHRLLDRYLEAGYRHIALSPPPGPRPTRWDLDAALAWLRRGFQLAGPGAGFHLLEASSWALVAALPWYSADVHGWTDALGREELVWFGPGQGCFRRVAMAKSDRWRILGLDAPDSVLQSAYERRAVLAGLTEAWQAAETWLGGEFGPLTIAGSDQTGPRLYLESLIGVQLAHRGFAHLAALADLPPGPAAATTPPEAQGLPTPPGRADEGEPQYRTSGLSENEPVSSKADLAARAPAGGPRRRPSSSDVASGRRGPRRRGPWQLGCARPPRRRAW